MTTGIVNSAAINAFGQSNMAFNDGLDNAERMNVPPLAEFGKFRAG